MKNNVASHTPPKRTGNDVLATFLAWRQLGKECALVTLVGIEGSAPQPLGSQMAVNEDGEWVGRISSGCTEAAIAAEAVRAIRHQCRMLERYGAGSKYLDITLPCGSGLDVYFDPLIPTEVVRDLHKCICNRQPISLTFRTDSPISKLYEIAPIDIPGPQQEELFLRRQIAVPHAFTKMHFPKLCVNIAGRGPILIALAQMAGILGWDVTAASPDNDTLAALQPLSPVSSPVSIHLTSPEAFGVNSFDGWTAAVLLFHEHEWEPEILKKVLQADGFYLGALGSRRAHQARCAALLDLGCDPERIAAIRGPVGLDIGSRTSEEIALAITGEILCTARQPTEQDSSHE